MDDKKYINECYDENELDDLKAIETEAESSREEDTVKSQEKKNTRLLQSTAEAEFSDVKEYPQCPFTYYEEGQVNVQLSSGNLQYDVTDFVLPGRNGFDVSIARRYDSGCANLVDMAPYVKSEKAWTGSRDNNHYTKTYGLGYGWSIVLPSIETVPYLDCSYLSLTGLAISGYDYILHLEDGRSLPIKRKSDDFDSYSLKDISIVTESGVIYHPHVANCQKNYDIIIKYKNGHKDYFKNANGDSGKRDQPEEQNFKLVIRQDKFGNTIFYDLKDWGGMTIVDTWGRTLNLAKTDQGFTWKLPGGENGKTYEISYKVNRTGNLQLQEVTNQAGYTTSYGYYNPDNYDMVMRYASKRAIGNTTDVKSRKYLLLSSINYPNNLQKKFEYQNDSDKTVLETLYGTKIANCHLLVKKDVVDGNVYNQVAYSYIRGISTGYNENLDKDVNWIGHIKSATVTRQNGIVETHTFSTTGQLTAKEVKINDILVSHSDYTYSTIFNPLVKSAEDKQYSITDPLLILEKKTEWEYSTDRKANVTKVIETYLDDPDNNQEAETTYDDYSNVIKTIRKKGSDQIAEKSKWSETLGNRVVESREIYVNEVLKEKTEYQYNDPNNPYCVTRESQHVFASGEYPGQAGGTVDTLYTYSNLQSSHSRYTHNIITRERTGIKDADGSACQSVKEEFTYDNWGRLISKKDPRNQVSTISYDSLGRVIEEVFPPVDGQRIANQSYYDDHLYYITKTDANGLKTRIQYTPFGEVQRVYQALTDKSQTDGIVLQDFRYNSWRELEKVITYDGNGTAENNIRRTECSIYDSMGRLATRTIPQVGYKEEYQYDEVFVDPENEKKYRREQKSIIGDTPGLNIVTECYIDQKGQVRKEFLAGQRTFTYNYDNCGNMIRKIDAQGKADQWEYDHANRVVKTTRTDAGQNRVTSIRYDALGNKRFSTDENGKVTEFQYDGAGRLIQMIAPFDGSGSRKVKYYYDAAGNITWEKKAQNSGWQETQYVYDARGRLSDIYQYVSSDNWIKTTYRYDVMDNVIQMRAGNTPSGEGQQVTKYTYDRMGNVLTVTDSRGGTEYFEYDKIGRKLRKTDRNGNRIEYQHDALERLVKETVSSRITGKAIKSEREYAYNKVGKLIWEASRETREGEQTVCLETRYEYNNKGEVIRQNDPGNVVKEYSYNAYGKRESFRMFHDGKANPDINLYYLYDDNCRLKQVRKGSIAGAVQAEYDYDAKGNRKALRYPQAGIETSYKYNDAGCITFMETKRNGAMISSWEYGYDVNGNLLSKMNKSGSTPITTFYRYDRLGRLTEEDYPGWKRVFYSYDAYSNRSKMMVEGKTKDEPVSVTNYEYDRDNRLEKEVRRQGKTTETYRYYYDNNGNQTFRLWEKTTPTPDYPGNVKFSGSWKREVPAVYEWRYYDGFNQLILINQDDREITYQYRGDGLRHSSTVKRLTERQQETKRLYWDGANIAAERTSQGNITCYLRGNNLIAGEKDGVVYYYILNEHGDVTQLRRKDGTCKTSYEYDAFGIEKNPKEDDENPFRYCGEYYDLSSNTYYLRARDYRPATGRFLTEDPHWHPGNMIYGDQEKKNDKHTIDMKGLSWLNSGVIMPDMEAINQSTNLYMYCMNNPIRYSDKNGEVALLAAIAIGAVAGAVISAGIELGMQLWKSKSLAEVEWGRVGIQAATGAVSGGLAASGVGIFGQIVGNAAISGISNAATQKIYTGKINTFELGVSIGVGAALGVIGGKGAYNGANKFSVSYVTQGSYLLRHDVIRYIDSDIAEKAIAETLKAITRSSAAGVLIEQVKGFTNQVVSRQNGAYLYN